MSQSYIHPFLLHSLLVVGSLSTAFPISFCYCFARRAEGRRRGTCTAQGLLFRQQIEKAPGSVLGWFPVSVPGSQFHGLPTSHQGPLGGISGFQQYHNSMEWAASCSTNSGFSRWACVALAAFQCSKLLESADICREAAVFCPCL